MWLDGLFRCGEVMDNQIKDIFCLIGLDRYCLCLNAEQNVSMMSCERHHCMKTLLIPFLPAISQSNAQRDSMSGRGTSALEQWTQAFIHPSGIEWKIRGWKGTDLIPYSQLAPIPLQFVISVWMFLGFWYTVRIIIIVIIQTSLCFKLSQHFFFFL